MPVLILIIVINGYMASSIGLTPQLTQSIILNNVIIVMDVLIVKDVTIVKNAIIVISQPI